MDHQVIGTVMPVLEMKLEPGESVVAEPGELSWMNGPIELSTSASGTAGSKGVFGAETLLAALTGPGKVWLQTLPLPNLASAINPYITHPEGKGDGGGGIHFGSDD